MCQTVVSNSAFINCCFSEMLLQKSILTTNAIHEQIFREKRFISFHHDIFAYFCAYLKIVFECFFNGNTYLKTSVYLCPSYFLGMLVSGC